MESAAGFGNLTIRPMRTEDVAAVQAFVSTCPPLGVHTAFTYWVLSQYSSTFSFVAESDGRLCGLLTALATDRLDPGLYLWQLGVSEELRGQGVAGRLLSQLAQAMPPAGVTSFDVSISPENEASRRTFQGFARTVGAAWEVVGRSRVVDLFFGHDDSETIHRLTLR